MNEDWPFSFRCLAALLIIQSGFLPQPQVSVGDAVAVAGSLGRMRGRVAVRMGRSFDCMLDMVGMKLAVAVGAGVVG